MNILRRILKKIFPAYIFDYTSYVEGKGRHRRLWKNVVILTSFVSLTPLIIMTVVNYHQYKSAFEAEMIYPVSRIASKTRQSLESFLAERRSVLNMIVRDKPFKELDDPKKLTALFRNLKESFGGFVDLGLIDSEGNQRTYAGPYDLKGKNYKGQDWFHEVRIRGIFVSDVFMGYRNFPHFVIAVIHETDDGSFYVLRATIDMSIINQEILSFGLRPSSDAFLINHNGILQTQSRFFGNVMDSCNIQVPPFSSKTEILKQYDNNNQSYILGYAYINQSPFILMEVTKPETHMSRWLSLKNNLILFLSVSIILIVIVIFWGSNYLVSHIRKANIQRDKVLHNIEYTNKMASIGRLAAGVAHEINNPLAIINENAGLLHDLVNMPDSDFPEKDKYNKLIGSIAKSVDRCSTITHRLLGFAKRIDTRIERIDLENLIKEVLGFLDKEASTRDISINYNIDSRLPSIESDKGQLQQVFLNILNNSFEAIDDGSTIDITFKVVSEDKVAITISDKGRGISAKDLERIFEPFFTTKKEKGTGLGLSITYGIVEKLGGNIRVDSQVGKGTSFTVTLPVKKQ